MNEQAQLGFAELLLPATAPSPAQAKRLAHSMGVIASQTLPGLAAGEWQQLDNNTVQARIGSGRATYCRKDKTGFTLTFGQQMIVDKLDPSLCQGWLTTTELRKRGYFSGLVSPLNLLSQTICHEFAHVLQFLEQPRWRRNQRSHDGHFYRLLDHIHQQGWGDDCRQQLLQAAQSDGLELQQVFVQTTAALDRKQYQAGAYVTFEHAGKSRQGRIIRCNTHTITVQVVERGVSKEWRVPYHLARR